MIKYLLLSLTLILNGCSVIIISNDISRASDQTYTQAVNSSKESPIQQSLTKCVFTDIILEETPKVPLDKVLSAASDYKTKSLILTDYISELRIYISNIKRQFAEQQNEIKQKCIN